MPNLNNINPLADNETELTEVELIIESYNISESDAQTLKDNEDLANLYLNLKHKYNSQKALLQEIADYFNTTDNGLSTKLNNFLKTK